MQLTRRKLASLSSIHEGPGSLIYYLDKSEYGRPVVIKIPKHDNPTKDEIERLENEYSITLDLDSPDIRRPVEKITIDDVPALVLEYIEGDILENTLVKKRASVTEVLSTAALAAQVLNDIHSRNIIHGNISSESILFNPATKRVKLIDFSLASPFDKQVSHLGNPGWLYGRLTYISPEQTGRMNRVVDYRTDLYSLGVVMYEMLAGRPPFEGDDALELVHAHIARTPRPLREIHPEIPALVADIVVKLLEKNAEDRYQSAAGLKADLEKCLAYLEGPGGRRDPQGLHFELGKNDIPLSFHIPQKLYGRHEEISMLMAAFERVAGGVSELMIVSGEPGIGKTALVAEVHKPITGKRGYFASSKFDHYQRNIPYAAFIAALNQFIEELLTEEDTVLGEMRREILSSLGANGAVLTEFIPALEKVIGVQPQAAPLTWEKQRIRFNLTFQKFMQAIATKHHPLALFIDDWQWADSASMELLKVIFSGESSGYLLLIMAFRDNEVPPAHPLRLTLSEIEKSGARMNSITLKPLAEQDINFLIADSLNCRPVAAMPLTVEVYKITRGNPFFNNQFLKMLYREGAINFDSKAGYWTYDAAKLTSLDLPDDVVIFMALRLKKLPQETRDVLFLASCMGGAIDLETLALVYKKPQAETVSALKQAAQEGMVLYVEEGRSNPIFRFIHDRVQQAAYSLFPEEQKQVTHLMIGRMMLKNLTEAQRDERVFEIVNHLNRAMELQNEAGERIELARLNMVAGRKARAASAFASAWNYFRTALGLLPGDSWQKDYKFTLVLHEAGVEASYFSGDSEAADLLIETMIREGKALFDTVRAYEIKILLLGGQNRFQEAINTGLKLLKRLGIDFPENLDQADIQTALLEARSYYHGKKIEDFAKLPLTDDPVRLAAMRVLESLSGAAYLSSPKLYLFIILKRTELIIKQGNFPTSSLCYASFGAVLSGRNVDIEAGFRFGQLALELLQRMDTKEYYSRVTCLVYGFINHWSKSVMDSLVPLRLAYYSGLETGDLEFAGYSAILYSGYSLYAGLIKDLHEFDMEISVFSKTLYQVKVLSIFHYLQMVQQTVHDLREGRPDVRFLFGEYYDEKSMLPHHIEANDQNGLFYLNSYKLLLSFIFGDYEQAVADAEQVEQYAGGVVGLAQVPVFYFFDSLARLALFRKKQSGDKNKLLERIMANQEKLKILALHAPMNCQYKYDLVEAVRSWMFGDRQEAMGFFDRAIQGADENGYMRDEAIACELAAEFYLELGRDKAAAGYIVDAYRGYLSWGANAVAEKLRNRYAEIPAISHLIRIVDEGPLPVAGRTTDDISSRQLDLATVIKATHAIAGEIDLGGLLKKLMRIAVENAGAQRGVLILEKDGEWAIEAQGDVDERDIEVLMGRNIAASNAVSPEIISHVLEARDSMVLDNASEYGNFIKDPYIISHKVKSVICMPLINQARISGIIYLENNRAANAFTADRLELLNILSTQMALSLDNARLYQKAQQEITERIKAEEAIKEEQQYNRMILDSVAAPMVIARISDSKVVYANPALAATGRISQQELIGRLSRDFYANIAERDKFVEILQRQGSVDNYEIELLHGDGSPYWALMSSRDIVYKGEPYFLSSFIDITDRKHAEEEIQASLKRNEILLRELYHRTKNNMQVISSMLSLQSDYVNSGETLEVFREMDNRIQCMSLVHKKLYESQDLSSLNMREYIIDLANMLIMSYRVVPDGVSLDFEMSDVNVLIDTAVPCGLIINELVSNALKYAFHEGEKGRLKIGLHRTGEGEIEMSVLDNGRGVPPDFDFRANARMGLKIVFALAEHQLQGSVDFKSGRGTECVIRFNDKLFKPRV